jgi:predicted ATPase/DNA-binding winged helix-turn-helix (wHTH) protein
MNMVEERSAVTFGPFRLVAPERRLERAGEVVQLGARALDILIVLTESAGEVVSKKMLMARVWPDLTVDEGSLRVHIAGLRKALCDGQHGARYISTVPGRGYCFVAPFKRDRSASRSTNAARTYERQNNLPPQLVSMVGRDRIVEAAADQVRAHRFITLCGPGGIGKTTVAVSIGHAMLDEFGGEVHFVDLGPLGEARLVATAIASTLGLAVQTADPAAALAAFLRDKRCLLILDGCEHVVDIVSELAERLHASAPLLHLLVTSREALRVEGEHVHPVPALASPPDEAGLTAETALDFPAVQLFVERAAATLGEFELGDADAPVVAQICRKLDGVALAIELAAGRVGGYGIRETARLLDGQLRLLWKGRRTAPPRQQTLQATLDWSHDLLDPAERKTLRRLAIFAGGFTPEAAAAVVADDASELGTVLDAFANLVAKSLVATDGGSAASRYRLLDTTRAYAARKLVASGELNEVARRHVVYFRTLMESVSAAPSPASEAEALGSYGEHVGNLRAALEWSFGPHGDTELGTGLAAAASRVFLATSLLTECHGWVERALTMLDESGRGGLRELRLQTALGHSLMFTRGNSDAARDALLRGLRLAEALASFEDQFQLLGRLHLFYERTGNFREAMSYARRAELVAHRLGNQEAIDASHVYLGISHHLSGNQEEARRQLEAAVTERNSDRGAAGAGYGFDHRSRARVALARTLWLLGEPENALASARRAVAEAEETGHPIALCIALIWAASVHLWRGDMTSAEADIDAFVAHADRHSLRPYYAVGRGIKGELAVRCGDIVPGIVLLQISLATLHQEHFELLTSAFTSALAEGLAASGKPDAALAAIEQGIEQVERNGDLFALPDLLRIKGEILASMGAAARRRAEATLRQAIELARSQHARAWELRAAIRLAQLWSSPRPAEAYDLLAACYGSFAEESATSDLVAAKTVLDELAGLHAF